MIQRIFFYLTIYVLITISCTTRNGNIILQNNNADSLKSLCIKYTMNANIDSLREVANIYLKQSKLNSYDYFKAKHFLILSDFNAKEYNKAVEDINTCLNNSHLQEYKDLLYHFNYTKARCYQFNGEFDNAINEYKNCSNINNIDPSNIDTIYNIVLNSLLHTMNTYHNAGRNNECLEYFKLLNTNKNLIFEYYERDIKSLLAYSYYRCDSTEQAQSTIEQALEKKLYKSSPDRLFRDYSYAAAINYGDLNKQDTVIYWCKKAIEAANEYGYNIGSQWTISVLAKIYHKTGRIDDALDLYMHSANLSKAIGDFKGESNAYNSMINFYLDWGQLDEANDLADISINNNLESKNIDKKILGEAYLTKGLVLSKIGDRDSTLYYWNLAEVCFSSSPYEEGQIDLDRKIGEYLIENNNTDLNNGIIRLNRALKSTSWYNKAPTYYFLSKAYIKQGNTEMGEKMLDSMSFILKGSPNNTYIENANLFALEHYLNKKDKDKVLYYSNEYLNEHKANYSNAISKKISEALIKYKTERKEQQLKLVSKEVEIKNLKLRKNLYFFISVFIFLALLIIWLIYWNKTYKLRQRILNDNYNRLLDELEESNINANKAEKQLEEVLSDTNSRTHLTAITPNIFRKDGETKFRERFNQLYPTFILKLREKIPNISRNEEILCMLITLGQNTNQIVDILCIEKGSVNMARYRLRSKMKLNKDDSLDDYLKEITST